MKKEFWALAAKLKGSLGGGSDVGSGERELNDRARVGFLRLCYHF